jgi:autophagy-related protein 9
MEREAGYEPLAQLFEIEETVSWAAFHDLDLFLARLYRYWEEKGFYSIVTARILNIIALAFTILASGFLLVGLDRRALREATCLWHGECTFWDVAVKTKVFQDGFTLWNVACSCYLIVVTAYWVFSLTHFVQELRGFIQVRHFFLAHMGMTDRVVASSSWPEIASRVVASQASVRLCLAKDLNELELVERIMRRENYLIGMLDSGILSLHPPIPGLRQHLMFTKTVEWNLYWCLLDPIFDEKTYSVRSSFLSDEAGLQCRFRMMAILNAVLSPFLLVFLVIYFFMKNAEALYHHPSMMGARRWSPLTWWQVREFNELPHFVSQRLGAGHAAAERYISLFPSYVLSHISRFVAFVAGSFAALLLALTITDERFLERELVGGRQTVWWLALLGVVLAASRSLIVMEDSSEMNLDPGLALLEVAVHTHHFPLHWQGRAHTLEVQNEFKAMFRYRASLFVEELFSVIITPLLLWFSLPECASDILKFVRENTITVEGVGDVCALSYGSGKREAFDQGKREQSIASFAATYPGWNPPHEISFLLSNVFKSAEEEEKKHNAPAPPAPGNWVPSSNPAPLPYPMLSLLAGQYPHLAKMYFELKSGNDMRLSHDNSPEEEQKKCDAFQSTSYIEGEVTLGNPFRFLSKAPQNGRIALGHALLESHRSKSRVIASTETTAFKGKIGSMSSELGRINV